jgi:DNA-binding NarL/FixJ family response regulator
MIRLVVADRNETMRLGMKALFERASARFQVWEAADRASLLNQVSNNNCNLVIMEPLLCAGTGEALIRQVRRESPNVNVLIYTELDERKHGVRAIRSGARGYVMKSSPSAELLSAVDRVVSGRMHLSDALAEEVALSAWSDRPDLPHETLSEREKIVFAMLVCGGSVKSIAATLNLSSKTVSTHKARTLVKMRCKSLSELVEYAISNGLKEEFEAQCQIW